MNQGRRQKATREVGSIFKLENTRLLPLKGADEPIYYTGKKTKNETKKPWISILYTWLVKYYQWRVWVRLSIKQGDREKKENK